MAESAAGETAAVGGTDKSVDYEYDDDDEFDMEAEMLRREFREASLLANGDSCGGPTAAVLEPSSQTQVNLTTDCRPSAAVAPSPHQLQTTAADHSSGGSSSADSRVAEMAYAYGNQSEYTAEDGGTSKHNCKTVVKSAAVPSFAAAMAANNNNNDDEYLVEQRLLGNGSNGGIGISTVVEVTAATSTPPKTNEKIICSPPEDFIPVATATVQ